MDKQYGLIVKDKVIKRPAIFNSDSDSGDEQEKPTGISTLKKKERIAQQKAIAEDPTIYQYDELYDEMQTKKRESKLARKDLDKKPKYIGKLLQCAERRKRENERRIERQVQKERESEGDLYKDKESFVTSAYKKKLEELKELEEKEKREEYLETIGDVRKQSDLSGFYRHLYEQQVKYDENEGTNKKEPETEQPKKQNKIKERKYRKREESKSDDENSNHSNEKISLQHLPSNIDADSDFSIDSESESDKETTEQLEEPSKTNDSETADLPIKVEKTDTPVKTDEQTDKIEPNDTEIKPIKLEVPKKPKVDIWKKRTVGEVFDAALKRYYERKALKLQSV